MSVLEYVYLSAAVNGTDGWITIDAPLWASGGFDVHSAAQRVMGSIRHDVARRGNGFVPMIEAAGAGIREGRLDVDRHPGEEALRVFAELDAIRNAMSVDRADPALQPADELVHR